MRIDRVHSGEPVAAADSLVIGGELGRRRPRRPRSEQALIRGALAGSEADLEALFRRYWPRAYRAAFLIVHDHAAAEDIAQEAFLAAIRRLDRFDRRRRFGPWLSTIVVNRAIDWARARTARRETGGEPADAPAPPEVPVGRYSQEVLTALGLALARASRGDRAALPARVQPGRDRAGARAAARHGQLAAAPRPGRARVTAERGGARMKPRAKHALRELPRARRGAAPSAGPGASSATPTSSASRRPAGRARRVRLALVPVLAVIAAGLVLSPAGATVGRLITKALGVRHAAPDAVLAALRRADRSCPGPAGPGRRPPTARSATSGDWRRGELVASRAVRGGGLEPTAWPRSTRAATSAGRSPARRSAIRAGSPRPATGSPTCRPGTLRVIAGDGTDDHLLAHARGATSRPHGDRVTRSSSPT